MKRRQYSSSIAFNDLLFNLLVGFVFLFIVAFILINPPTKRNIKTTTNPVEKFPIDKKVTVIAIIIPKIPKKFPCRDVSGEESPLKAKINNIPEIR